MSAHEPLPPIPADAPKRGSRWKHTKSRKHYGVLAVGYNEADLSVVVVYTRAQTVWVRPLANFLERFRRDDPPIYVSAPPPKPVEKREDM